MGNKNSNQKVEKDAPSTNRNNEQSIGEVMNPSIFDAINIAQSNTSSGHNVTSVSRFSNLTKNSFVAANKSAMKYEAELNLNNLSVIMENQEYRSSKNDA